MNDLNPCACCHISDKIGGIDLKLEKGTFNGWFSILFCQIGFYK